uniref:C1q domain-containing protein n=1 Tax=Maylandia zebra TaxID=106582 RepID=A0A3P9B0V3_9CICH
MEIMVFFSLLLLACSVSTNPIDTDIENHDQQISNQQPCPQDIHDVLRELTASLTEQKSLTLKQKVLNNDISLSLSATQVAFSAFLMNQGTGYTGPFPTLFTLIFKRAVTNIGNAYNQHTGIFTAPVRGVYHFDWKVYGKENIQAGALLYRNGEKISIAYELPTSGGVSASNAASLLLQAGDQVSVRLSAYSRIYENPDNHTTFSGHLLFTM